MAKSQNTPAKKLLVVALGIMSDVDDLLGSAEAKAQKLATYAPSTIALAGTLAIGTVRNMPEGEKKERAKVHHQTLIKAVNVILHEKGQHLNAALNKEKAIFVADYKKPDNASGKNGKAATNKKAELAKAQESAKIARSAAKVSQAEELKQKRRADRAEKVGHSTLSALQKMTIERDQLKAILAEISKTAAGKKSVAAARKVVKAASA